MNVEWTIWFFPTVFIPWFLLYAPSPACSVKLRLPSVFEYGMKLRRSTRLRRVFKCLFFVFLLAGGFSSNSHLLGDEQRPNIIFLYSDDHTPQAIGAYQETLQYGLQLDHTPTPNIDRLAEQGMRFDNAFVTNSICKPSRAVMLSGLHSHLNGVPTNGQSIAPRLLTFPKLLRKSGYQTAVVGKWHLGTAPQGFDYYEVLHGQGPYYNPEMRRPGKNRQFHGHTTEITTNRALTWLKTKRNGDQPFFLMLNQKAPHRNWLPGPDHLHDYKQRDLPEPDTLFSDYSGLSSAADHQKMEIANHLRWNKDLKLPGGISGRQHYNWLQLVSENDLTKRQRRRIEWAYYPENQKLFARRGEMSKKEIIRWRYQRYVKDYLRVIRGVDDGVGRLMDYLNRSGLDENTIVIYSADQGFFLGENGWFDKRWIYEESLRQPLIVRWPGTVEPGSTDEHLVQNIDFAPTLLDLANVEVPERMQGRSLVPLMKGKDPDSWRDAIYYHFYEGKRGPHDTPRHYGIRTKRYTLAHFYRLDEWELFDLKKDPEQTTSVYGKPEYREVQKRLKKKLNELQQKIGEEHPEADVQKIIQQAYQQW